MSQDTSEKENQHFHIPSRKETINITNADILLLMNNLCWNVSDLANWVFQNKEFLA